MIYSHDRFIFLCSNVIRVLFVQSISEFIQPRRIIISTAVIHSFTRLNRDGVGIERRGCNMITSLVVFKVKAVLLILPEHIQIAIFRRLVIN